MGELKIEGFDHPALHDQVRSIDPRVHLIRVTVHEDDHVWIGVSYAERDEVGLEITPERRQTRRRSLQEVLRVQLDYPVEVEVIEA